MAIFEQLQKNKGTISSALGKTLAQKVLAGDRGILAEAIKLSSWQPDENDQKAIRAGAAKIVELVAEARPEMVAPSLEKLLPALVVAEPQTRWMIICAFGFCAKANPEAAAKALPFAEKYIKWKEGLCIASSADLFLGDLGAVSSGLAKKVFPLLEKSILDVIRNEEDWILEAFIKLLPMVGKREKAIMAKFARANENKGKKSSQGRVKKLLRILGDK